MILGPGHLCWFEGREKEGFLMYGKTQVKNWPPPPKTWPPPPAVSDPSNDQYIPFLTDYPLMTVITVISQSILRKTFFLKILRIPHTHGVFRHFSTSLRRVPRRWRGPAADRATPGGRSVSPKVLEPVHFGAKHLRRNQYLTVHILVHF